MKGWYKLLRVTLRKFWGIINNLVPKRLNQITVLCDDKGVLNLKNKVFLNITVFWSFITRTPSWC